MKYILGPFIRLLYVLAYIIIFVFMIVESTVRFFCYIPYGILSYILVGKWKDCLCCDSKYWLSYYLTKLFHEIFKYYNPKAFKIIM